MPNKVWINVKDPVYELAARWQQFLLKPAGVRSRIMVRTLIGSWIAMLPGYLQKETEHRPVTAADDNDEATAEPSISSSAIMLDDVRVRIEVSVMWAVNDKPTVPLRYQPQYRRHVY
uniref:Uncharacterized protein n=1 Tax=Anopheles maculatus TaxID=74869 RepID=A0A182T4M7_9DIPT